MRYLNSKNYIIRFLSEIKQFFECDALIICRYGNTSGSPARILYLNTKPNDKIYLPIGVERTILKIENKHKRSSTGG